MTIDVLNMTTTGDETDYGDGAIRLFAGQPEDVSTDTHVIVNAQALEVADDGTPARMLCNGLQCRRCTTPDCPVVPLPPPHEPAPAPNMALRKADADISNSRVAFRSMPPIGPVLVLAWPSDGLPSIDDISGTVHDWLASNGETFDQSIVFHLYAITAASNQDEQGVLDRTIIAIPVRRFTPQA